MKKTNNSEKQNRDYSSDIPDLDIIDLDKESGSEILSDSDSRKRTSDLGDNAEFSNTSDAPDADLDDYNDDADEGETTKTTPKFPFRINMHLAVLAVFVIFVLAVVLKFINWGNEVDLDEIFKDGMGSYDNTFDSILPLITYEGDPIYKDYGEGSNILFFGNAPLADDRNSEDNLVNIIQKQTGANVYNCSVSGSYLAAQNNTIYGNESPLDVFNFYWLCFLATGDSIDQFYLDAVELLGEDCPPEAMEVYNTLNSIDLNTIDVVAIMYDASDYLAGHNMYSDQDFTDITQFTGNLAAGIWLLQDNYPNLRFIVMSPTYAHALDEDGNYVSSAIQRYGQDILSTYVIKQAEACNLRSVTFIDNLYGTITEDNADSYLTDHIHLNVEGRKKVAERFAKALCYYNGRSE